MAQTIDTSKWQLVGSARTALLDISGGFYRLRREIEALAGLDVAERSLYAAGGEGGRSIFSAMLARGELQRNEVGFVSGVETYTQAGFGQFSISQLDVGAARATLTCPDAFESWAFVQNHAPAERAVCAYSAGVLAALMAQVTGRDDVACVETACVAAGGATCTFEVAPAAESMRQRSLTDASDVAR